MALEQFFVRRVSEKKKNIFKPGAGFRNNKFNISNSLFYHYLPYQVADRVNSDGAPASAKIKCKDV